MKIRLPFIIIILGCIANSYSRMPDSSGLFWKPGIICEFEYGYSFVSMYRLNKYYLHDFGEVTGLFDDQFHYCSFMTPSFGLFSKNNIYSISGSFSKSKLKAHDVDMGDFIWQSLYLSIDLWTVNASYRRMIVLKPFILGIGATACFGKGSADVETESDHLKNREKGNLIEGFGGGGNISGELNYVLLRHFIIGIKISGNVFITEALERKYLGEWNPDSIGQAINLDYSGVSGLFKIGVFW